MKRLLLLPVFLYISLTIDGQSVLGQGFNNLFNKTWEADAQWGDGSPFKQEVTFEPLLEERVVIARSKGFVDKEQTKYGWRNFGIRSFEEKNGKIHFWEFDVFGGLTKGEVTIKDNDVYYQYQYGEMVITDSWEFVNDSTYNYRVGVFEDDSWQQTFLQTTFTVKNHLPGFPEVRDLLTGTWVSKAWDGELQEYWSIGHDGNLLQNAQYTENGAVLYEAISRMEQVGDDFVLFSVIKDSNPKIFKVSSYKENEITFHNSDYQNPSTVIYKFVSETRYDRTIIGVENGAPTSYTFEFHKKE